MNPYILIGFLSVINFNTIFFIIIGVILGITIGAIPGLGSCVGIALLIPATFYMDPITGLAMLGAVYCGTVYGGSISAILLNTPGTSAAVATSWDGYELTKRGSGGKALGIATISSFIGGIFSAFCLLSIAPPLAEFAIKFGPPERFLLATLGLTVIIAVSSDSLLKGLMAGFFGLFLSTIGIDRVTGGFRFTFNIISLVDGIPLVPALIGLFSVAQALSLIEVKGKKIVNEKIYKVTDKTLPTLDDFKEIWKVNVRSSILGTIIGIIPGAGTSIAAFIGYSEAKRTSKHPEIFGKGSIEGIAGAETANNAVTGGSLVPLLTLGIPGNAASAVFLGGLLIHGLIPGPDLFTKHATITYALMASLFFSNSAMLLFGLGGAKMFAKVVKTPSNILAPLIMIFSIIGAYTIRNNIFDIYVMFIFSLVGYLMEKNGFPRAPVLLALILGPIAESEFRRTLAILRGNIISIFLRPISLILMVLITLSLLYPILMTKKENTIIH